MRKIAMTTSYFMKFGDEADGFARMRDYGFEACDYSPLSDPAGEIFCLSAEERARVLEKARAHAEAAGVEIYQAHGPWVWPTGNDTVEGRRFWADAMRADLDICAALGCPHLVVHPIMPYGDRSDTDEEGYLHINRTFFEDVLEHCEKTGVKLLLENMPFLRQSLSTPAAMAEFVRSFKTELFAMCLDTGHALVFGEDLGESVRTVGGLLRGLHVHDNDGKSDRHQCPYFGIGNWRSFKEALTLVPESVPLSLECSTAMLPAALREHFLRGYAEAARSLCE